MDTTITILIWCAHRAQNQHIQNSSYTSNSILYVKEVEFMAKNKRGRVKQYREYYRQLSTHKVTV